MWRGQLELDPDTLKSGEKRAKFINSISENINAMLEVYRRIQLRANPSEHANLLSQVHSVYEVFDKGKISDVDTMQKKLDALISESQVVLKAEWKRVKKGEPIYRVTKTVLLLIVMSILAVGSLYFLNKISIVWHAQQSAPTDRS
jgi:hypothetical protein